jgi:hypothetical protein
LRNAADVLWHVISVVSDEGERKFGFAVPP